MFPIPKHGVDYFSNLPFITIWVFLKSLIFSITKSCSLMKGVKTMDKGNIICIFMY